MRREDLPPHKTATYVLPELRTVYVSVPKAACTSMKWLVADLAGEDPTRFYGALSRETGRAMTIHHRARWEHTPMLHRLEDDELGEVDVDRGWFVFAVVRHPAARLWSGWQSKFLLREPRFLDLHPEAPWPRMPESSADVVEDFHEFVGLLRDDPGAPILRDRHFRPQTELLATDRMRYSRIYTTKQIPALLEDLAAHLGRAPDDLPVLRRSNETPLPAVPALFDDLTTRTVHEFYRSDFEQLDVGSPQPDLPPGADEFSGEQLAEVHRLVERGERIGDLYRIAKELQSETRRLTRRLERQETRAARAADTPPESRPSLARRAYRTVRGVRQSS